jgi:hypothetical protein
MLDKITADAYRMGIVMTLALRVGAKASRELYQGACSYTGSNDIVQWFERFQAQNDVRPFMRTVLRAIRRRDFRARPVPASSGGPPPRGLVLRGVPIRSLPGDRGRMDHP